eukprot:gene2685-biopygen2256
MSDGFDIRPSGIVETNLARFSGVSGTPMKDSSSAVSPITGAMQLTRMPSGASSTAIDFDIRFTAPLLALYQVRPGRGRTPAVEPMLMMRPCFRARTFDLILGLTLLGYAVNLFIFLMGRIRINAAPIVDGQSAATLANYADPLPQALVLTAIVIGFALTAVMLEPTQMDFGHTFVATDPDGHRLRVFVPGGA